MFERFASAVLLVTSATAWWSYPGDGCCSLYAGKYFTMDNATFCVSSTDREESYDLKAYFDFDKIDSFECGKHTFIRFC